MTHKQLKQLRSVDVSETRNRVAAAFALDGRSQMDCARETGFTPQYVSDVKAGRFHSISLDNAHKFAAFFGCRIEDLFPSKETVSA